MEPAEFDSLFFLRSFVEPPEYDCSYFLRLFEAFGMEWRDALELFTIYGILLSCRVNIMEDPDTEQANHGLAVRMWSRFLVYIFEEFEVVGENTIPPFEEIWDEVDYMTSRLTYPGYLLETKHMRGVPMRRYHYVFLKSLEKSRYAANMKLFLDDQPKYEKILGSYSKQVNEAHVNLKHEDHNGSFAELNRQIHLHAEEPLFLAELLRIYTEMAMHVVDFMKQHNGQPCMGDIKRKGRALERLFAYEINSPFSRLTWGIRTDLAHFNFMANFIIMIMHVKVFMFKDNIPLDKMVWHLHRHIIREGFRSEFPGRQRRIMMRQLSIFGWQDVYTDDDNAAVTNWNPPLYTGEYFDPDTGFLLPHAFEDVEFVAHGPELSIDKYAEIADTKELPADMPCGICYDDFNTEAVASVAMKLDCTHIFHADCLNCLINGIEDFSNLCPVCRHQICDRRPKMAVVENNEIT